MSNRKIGDDDLNAYVDGLLDDDDMAAVAEHLAATPADAGKVAAYVRQRRELRELTSLLVTPPPIATKELERRLARRLRRGRLPGHIRYAAIALLAVGIGWWGHGLAIRDSVPTVADEAAEAHVVLASNPDLPLIGSPENLPFLNQRLGVEMEPPDLEGIGLYLAGLNLVPTDVCAAGQFVYRDVQGRTVSLLVVHGEGEEEGGKLPRMVQRDGLILGYWREGELDFVMAGEVPREEIERAIKLVRAGGET